MELRWHAKTNSGLAFIEDIYINKPVIPYIRLILYI